MSDIINLVENTLLAPSGLTLSEIEAQLASLHVNHIDYSDFYFQSEVNESWSIEDGIVKSGSFNIDTGVGVRVISGEKTGFAYADTIDPKALATTVKSARSIVSSGMSAQACAFKAVDNPGFYPALNPLESLSADEKVQFLNEVDQYTRSLDSNVVEVISSLSGTYEVIMIMASDGTLAHDVRPLVRLNVTAIVEDGDKREQGFSGGGGRYMYSDLLKPEKWQAYARDAVRLATQNCHAIDAPAGNMDIVLGNGWPGVLLHEAFGHGLEGDFNRKKTSSFHDLMGEKVASDICTVVDNGTLPGRRGSLNVDDEGTPTQNTVLVEKGVLKSFMQDKHNAMLMGANSTGNGRRESYAHLTMPRMTNTYMLPGEHGPDEIIASVDNGIYAKNFSGGAVDITSGKFVFVANEAYLIENGKISTPVKGATLIGDGPSALLKVTMVGNDLALDEGVGVCGKDGQSVPVGVGQPTLRVNDITVGGTDKN